MNRGSPARLAVAAARGRPFNEAPIHESGKSGGGGRIRGGLHSFNEAPIHESGKSGACREEPRPLELPSMRPRFMNRGSGRPLIGRTGAHRLQ